MTLSKVIKELIRPLISNKMVNPVVMAISRMIRPFVSDDLLVRIPFNGVVRCRLGDAKTLALCSEADDPLVSGLYFRGLDGYEPESIDLYRTLAQNAKTILDIGANTGIYAMVAGVENPLSQVHAFEPVPRIYKRLVKNRDLNQAHNVQLTQCVVADFCGQTTLYIPIGKMPTSSSTAKGHRRAEEAIEVSTITLDQYVDTQHIARVDLIKIDTETTEPQVLKGGLKVIERDRPIIICEVLRTHWGKAIEETLAGLGYNYYWITAKGLVKRDTIEGDPDFKYLNYLFIQPSQLALVESKICLDK